MKRKTAKQREQECKDMADVCELAHERMSNECKKNRIKIHCKSASDCGDVTQDHLPFRHESHYTRLAQSVFDKHYDIIIERTGL